MKLLELQLLAFGPFTNCTLDLSAGHEGLHIIYGANEAGKSTALRAVTNLLFGIPDRSPDNFVHDYNNMKIGARIRNAKNDEIELIRRKGRKNTLLDAHEKSMDSSFFQDILGGMNEELFLSQFGISYENLLQGGEEILKGKGNVGESLFAAGLGNVGIQEVLMSLEKEADDLFRLKASKPLLNKMIKEFKDEKKKIQEFSLPSRAWLELDVKLKKDLQEVNHLNHDLEIKDREKNRLERLQHAFPLIAKRKHCIAELNNLQDIIVLPESYPQERRDLVSTLDQAMDRKERAEKKLQQEKEHLENIEVQEEIIHHEKIIKELHLSLGSHQKATKDLIGLQSEWKQHNTTAESILNDLHPGHSQNEVESFRIPATQRVRIRDLADQYLSLETEERSVRKKLEKQNRDIAEITSNLKKLDSIRDPSALKQSVKRIIKHSRLEEELQNSLHEIQTKEQQIEIELKKLPLWTGEIDMLEKLAIPTFETIDRFESKFNELQSRLKSIDEKSNRTNNQLTNSEKKIKELQLSGSVPTEEELLKLREIREKGWQIIRKIWLEGKEVSEEIKSYSSEIPLHEAYEQKVHESDEMSDRLRREAKRVANLANLLVSQEENQFELQHCKTEHMQLEQEFSKIENEWKETWKPSGIIPVPPREMRTWIQKQQQVVKDAKEIRQDRQKADQLKKQIDGFKHELDTCLTGLGEDGVGNNESLEPLLDHCQSIANAIENEIKEKHRLEQELQKLKNDNDTAEQEQIEIMNNLTDWKKKWASEIRALGLEGNATPSEVNVVLTKLEELFKSIDSTASLQARIEGIQRDAKEFKEQVDGITTRISPDLVDLPVDQAVVQLNARLNVAQQNKATLLEINRKKEELEKEIKNEEDVIKKTDTRLNTMCREVKCKSADELQELEKKSNTKRELQKALAQIEEQLNSYTGGQSIDEYVEKVEGTDVDSIPGQLSTLSDDLKKLQTQRSELDQEIGRTQKSLENMDGSSKAAESAENAEGLLASIRKGTDQYIRLRLASLILRQEIERYRAENQDPVLRCASDIFSQITLKSFSSLGTDFDDNDEHVLVGIRPSGQKIHVEGMSNGTRDQLYLALRLASLKKYLEVNEPVPFIVDDILINFDDERAATVLNVINEISRSTQVILFTHHKHITELAERRIGTTNDLFIHELVG